MIKKLPLLAILFTGSLFFVTSCGQQVQEQEQKTVITTLNKEKKSKKSIEEKSIATLERFQFDYDMQKDPGTGIIPKEEKDAELFSALQSKQASELSRRAGVIYESRGPSNLGGRTRALAVDVSDATGNTMLAGGVSSGVFRTTDGGLSWVKVSSNDEIHNVTAIAQDPRPGFQNRWYYGTGELLGNSAALGNAFYLGQGIWESTDGGLSWSQMPATNSAFETFTTAFDIINSLAISPTTGELFVAAFGSLFRYDGVNFNQELLSFTGGGETDVKVTATGRVFASFSGNNTLEGVYTSPNGNGSYTRIAQNGSPAGWSANGRTVLGIAPSNTDIVYALFNNGTTGIEADLWRYDLNTDTWTDFSGKLPDEAGGDLAGNDPFAIQGGYDLEVSVKPDDQNFVVIGGTNVYRIENIITDVTFSRIGGYISNFSYGKYGSGNAAANDGDTHHPDIHDLVFSPFNSNTLLSGTDGGVHTTNVTDATVRWTNLNNNYQTYQYYHVGMDPLAGSDFVIGGAQDNGTTLGGAAPLTGVASSTEVLDFASGDGVAVAIGRTGSGIIDLADIQLYYGTQNGNISAFRNGNSNIRPTGTSSSIFVTYFYLDPDTNTLYYADGSDIYRTLEAQNVTANDVMGSSANWANIGSLSTNENIRSMASTRGAYNASSSFTLIGGQNGGVFRHDDPRGTNLSTADNITPAGATTGAGSVVSGVAIHPTNSDIAMVVYSNYGIDNMYLTINATNANPTWTLVERNLASFSIRSVAIADVLGSTSYYVGTARGLYSSSNPITTDWELESPNEIGLAIVSSLVYRDADDVMLIGTHGNGMYETSFEETLSTTESVFDTNTMSLYPNPATNLVTLGYTGNEQLHKLDITGLNGKSIKTLDLTNFNQKQELDVSELASGIYFVSITSKIGTTIVKKLIIK